jgi:hypothetical protein
MGMKTINQRSRPRPAVGRGIARTISISFALVAAMLGSAGAQPDPTAPPPPVPGDPTVGGPPNTIGGDVLFVLPTGDYGDVANLGIGIAGRFSHALNPQLSITGRLGYIYHLVDDALGDDFSVAMILVYGGARYMLKPMPNGGIFGFGELGINHVAVSFGDIDDSEDDLSLNLGAGYQTGQIEARGSLFYTSGDEDSLVGLMLGVGYNFTAF